MAESDYEPIEVEMSEATGLSVETLRALKTRFKEDGLTGEDFKKFLAWKAAKLGNIVRFR